MDPYPGQQWFQSPPGQQWFQSHPGQQPSRSFYKVFQGSFQFLRFPRLKGSRVLPVSLLTWFPKVLKVSPQFNVLKRFSRFTQQIHLVSKFWFSTSLVQVLHSQGSQVHLVFKAHLVSKVLKVKRISRFQSSALPSFQGSASFFKFHLVLRVHPVFKVLVFKSSQDSQGSQVHRFPRLTRFLLQGGAKVLQFQGCILFSKVHRFSKVLKILKAQKHLPSFQGSPGSRFKAQSSLAPVSKALKGSHLVSGFQSLKVHPPFPRFQGSLGPPSFKALKEGSQAHLVVRLTPPLDSQVSKISRFSKVIQVHLRLVSSRQVGQEQIKDQNIYKQFYQGLQDGNVITL
jgi:hypothetical protein